MSGADPPPYQPDLHIVDAAAAAPMLAVYAGCLLTRRFARAAFAKQRRAMTAPDLIEEIGAVWRHAAPASRLAIAARAELTLLDAAPRRPENPPTGPLHSEARRGLPEPGPTSVYTRLPSARW